MSQAPSAENSKNKLASSASSDDNKTSGKKQLSSGSHSTSNLRLRRQHSSGCNPFITSTIEEEDYKDDDKTKKARDQITITSEPDEDDHPEEKLIMSARDSKPSTQDVIITTEFVDNHPMNKTEANLKSKIGVVAASQDQVENVRAFGSVDFDDDEDAMDVNDSRPSFPFEPLDTDNGTKSLGSRLEADKHKNDRYSNNNSNHHFDD